MRVLSPDLRQLHFGVPGPRLFLHPVSGVPSRLSVARKLCLRSQSAPRRPHHRPWLRGTAGSEPLAGFSLERAGCSAAALGPTPSSPPHLLPVLAEAQARPDPCASAASANPLPPPPSVCFPGFSARSAPAGSTGWPSGQRPHFSWLQAPWDLPLATSPGTFPAVSLASAVPTWPSAALLGPLHLLCVPGKFLDSHPRGAVAVSACLQNRPLLGALPGASAAALVSLVAPHSLALSPCV